MNALKQKLREEIAVTGSISFARFIALALYCPVYGFYERERDTIGRRGDYYTSVSVGSLFGELLAWQFAEWLVECGAAGEGNPLQIVEAGAHDGRLAGDILKWMRAWRPELFAPMEYWIVEPSPRRREWQAKTLAEFAPRVRWQEELRSKCEDLPGAVPHAPAAINHRPASSVRGVFFANELLDAMPVHRLGWDAKRRLWFEWGVGVSGENFIWMKMPGVIEPTAHAIQSRFQLPVSPFELPTQLLDVLPDGFIVEISSDALNWWQSAGEALARGKLLAIDYGLSAGQFLSAERCGGTSRAYHRHRLCADLLANAGEQDITAHVNFTALQTAGEGAGLKTDCLLTQTQFLTRILERTGGGAMGFSGWSPARMRQFKTLIHPDHLGQAFRVLIQSREA